MGERRFRTVDGLAGILGLISLWLMVRGGIKEFEAMHAWALAVACVALGVAFWAMGTCLSDRVVRRVSRRLEEKVTKTAERAVTSALRESVLDELSQQQR